MINAVTIAGNLTRDMEIRTTQSGSIVGTVGIAVNDRRQSKESGKWEDVPYFFNLVMFGKRAEGAAKVLTKGKHVTVQGKLVWSSWEDAEGAKRSKVEIVVNDFELDRRGASDADGAGAGEAQAPGRADDEPAVTDLAYGDIPF